MKPEGLLQERADRRTTNTIGHEVILLAFLAMVFLVGHPASGQGGGATYYVSMLSGDDSNPGTSPGSPWKTIGKVNSMSFSPGDSILFHRGESWQEALFFAHSGSEGNPIVIGAYGSGERPIIEQVLEVPGWTDPDNWSPIQTFWQIDLSSLQVPDPQRLWIDGTEAHHSSEWSFAPSNGHLRVRSPTNPAETFSSIEGLMGDPSIPGWMSRTVQVRGSYLDIRDLQIQGGTYGAFQVQGGDHLRVHDNDIGEYAVAGMRLVNYQDAPAESCEVFDNTFDSGARYKAGHFVPPHDGLTMDLGVHHCSIHDNVFLDWGHTAIQLRTLVENPPSGGVHDNDIFRNDISAPDISYGRPFGTEGNTLEDQTYNNHFYNNTIHHTTVQSQIGGNDNALTYNLFHDLGQSYKGCGLAISLASYNNQVSRNNVFANNVFYNIPEGAVGFGGDASNPNQQSVATNSGNVVANNLVVNCTANPVGCGGQAPRDSCFWISETHAPQLFLNNLAYDPSGPPVIVDYRGENLTVGEFNSRNGENGDVIVANLSLDPMLADPGNGLFQLLPGSPAIDSGTDLGLAFDFAGNPVPYGIHPDIGAFEVQTTFATRVPASGWWAWVLLTGLIAAAALSRVRRPTYHH